MSFKAEMKNYSYNIRLPKETLMIFVRLLYMIIIQYDISGKGRNNDVQLNFTLL